MVAGKITSRVPKAFGELVPAGFQDGQGKKFFYSNR
jgi:hypothetical protein